MTKYRVGGINPINRFKTLTDAINSAKDDDIIEIHKTINENVVVDKHLIINGNNNDFLVPLGKTGISVNTDIEISDLTFKVCRRSNALLLNASARYSNIKIELQGPIREFYPLILIQQGKHEFYDCQLQNLHAYPDAQVSITNSTLKSYYPADVYLNTRDDMNIFQCAVEIVDSHIASTLFKGHTTLSNCQLLRYVDIEQDTLIKDCQLVLASQTPKKNWNKKEPEHGPLKDGIDIKYAVAIKNTSVVIDNYQVSQSDPSFFGFYITDSDVTIQNTNIQDNLTKNAAFKSTLAFKDTQDANYWHLSETRVARVRSKIQSNDDYVPAIEKLNNMIGLENVKNQINTILNTIKADHQVSKNNEFSYNMIFAGDPGTGKTTIAKLVTEALFEIGAIDKFNLVVTSAQDMTKGYVGQSGEQARKIFESAVGGVLFIDEAYQLSVKDDTTSFNSDIMTVLTDYTENRRSDIIVIAAGYTKEMQEFLASNVGLQRRFQWIEFEDYQAEDLVKIFHKFTNAYNLIYETPETSHPLLVECFKQLINYYLTHPDTRGRITNGGNGGLVRDVFQQIVHNIDARQASVITNEDIKNGFTNAARKAVNQLGKP